MTIESVSCKYCGPFGDYTGYGEANRNAIRALYEAGVKVTTERVSYTTQEFAYGKAYEIASKQEGTDIPYDIKIIHVPSDGYLKFLEPNKYHIGHLFWETDSLSKTWVWNCNLVDEIWTGGEWHKENFRRAGVKVPIYVFPQAIDTDPTLYKPFVIPESKGFLFYSIFQWIERKNPRALLEAYWREFENEENVTLLIKSYGMNLTGEEFQRIKSDIKRWKAEIGLSKYPRTLLLTRMLTRDDIMRLHITGDCFVSTHRGEGWGIPQVEAMSIGNPIISTSLGGVHEMLTNNENALLTNYTWNNVKNMDFAPWYSSNQRWADVDLKDLRQKMRWVFQNPVKVKEIGMAAQKLVKDKLSYKVVGKMMSDRLFEIQKLL
jgi:glycosyltransferase involved in cell wall biosynthesis